MIFFIPYYTTIAPLSADNLICCPEPTAKYFSGRVVPKYRHPRSGRLTFALLPMIFDLFFDTFLTTS
jgi:hypothetical protein